MDLIAETPLFYMFNQNYSCMHGECYWVYMSTSNSLNNAIDNICDLNDFKCLGYLWLEAKEWHYYSIATKPDIKPCMSDRIK